MHESISHNTLKPKLYSYWRSTAAYRVRIGLALKNIEYDYIPVDLVQNGGEQFASQYSEINTQALVPTYVTREGRTITQSLAILQRLDLDYTNSPLLPAPSHEYDRALEISLIIDCETHPLNNLRVLKYLTEEMKISDEQKHQWYEHWVAAGFKSIEKLLTQTHEKLYCCSDEPSMADIFLVAQMYNANRFNVPLNNYPIIQQKVARCLELPAFQQAHPDQQKDANKKGKVQ